MQVGNWSDYGVRFATAPDLGGDGRLLDTNVIAHDISPLPSNAGPDHCTGVMKNADLDDPGAEVTPGTVRLTIGICDGIADYSVKLRR